MDLAIRTGIAKKQLVDFYYHGLPRIAEPHVYGIHEGKYQMLVYQVRGQSRSGALPDWRRVELSEVTNLRLLDEFFPGPRPTPSGKHSEFDTILAIVR